MNHDILRLKDFSFFCLCFLKYIDNLGDELWKNIKIKCSQNRIEVIHQKKIVDIIYNLKKWSGSKENVNERRKVVDRK